MAEIKVTQPGRLERLNWLSKPLLVFFLQLSFTSLLVMGLTVSLGVNGFHQWLVTHPGLASLGLTVTGEIIVILLLSGRWGFPRLQDLLGKRTWNLTTVKIGLVTYLALMVTVLLSSLILSVIPFQRVTPAAGGFLLAESSLTGRVFTVLVITLFAPLLEEILYRGLAVTSETNQVQNKALIISTFLFTLLHYQGFTPGGLVLLSQVGLTAGVLGCVRTRSNLPSTVIAHSLFNSAQLLLLLL